MNKINSKTLITLIKESSEKLNYKYYIQDNDLDEKDPVIKLIHLKFPKISDMFEQLESPKILEFVGECHAHCFQNLIREAFYSINQFSKTAEPRFHDEYKNIIDIIDYINIDDTKQKEFSSLKEASADVAIFKLRNSFAQSLPKQRTVQAFVGVELPMVGESSQMCPKAIDAIGHAVNMPIATCRDQCIDSRVGVDGSVRCAYTDWKKHVESQKKVKMLYQTISSPEDYSLDNDLTLDIMNEKSRGKGDFLKPDTNFDKQNNKPNDYSEIEVLDFRKNKEDKKEDKDTLGIQIEEKFISTKTNKEMTLDEMLEDYQSGLSDDEIDECLEVLNLKHNE